MLVACRHSSPVCSLRGPITVTAVTSEMMGYAIDDAMEVGVGRQADRPDNSGSWHVSAQSRGWGHAVGVSVQV